MTTARQVLALETRHHPLLETSGHTCRRRVRNRVDRASINQKALLPVYDAISECTYCFGTTQLASANSPQQLSDATFSPSLYASSPHVPHPHTHGTRSLSLPHAHPHLRPQPHPTRLPSRLDDTSAAQWLGSVLRPPTGSSSRCWSTCSWHMQSRCPFCSVW